jgi:hypothetical protein
MFACRHQLHLVMCCYKMLMSLFTLLDYTGRNIFDVYVVARL